jgi:Otopetrin
MVLFFVWIWRESYYTFSVLQAYIVEIILYVFTGAAVCVAWCRIRGLKFDYSEGSKLDDTLLIISQMGVYVFPTFILISGHHTIFGNSTREDICGLVSTFLETLQSTIQTLFLLDATRRRPKKAKHVDKKPGREFVTFLLVCNFNLWAIHSMEAWRQQLYPQQLRFYGTWTVRDCAVNFSLNLPESSKEAT